MTSTDLSGIDLKLARAKAHIADLNHVVACVLEPPKHRFKTQRDPDSGDYVVRVYDLPAVPREVALDVGEIVYQLRSALDHLAWQLVLLDGKEPGRSTYFPVHDAPSDKNGKPRPPNTDPRIADPEILRLLEECQPYRQPTGHDHLDPWDAHKTAPWILNALSNFDKHRLLLVMVQAYDIYGRWADHNPGDLVAYKVSVAPLEDGSAVEWYDLKGAGQPLGFDPQPRLHVTIRDAETYRIDHIDVAYVLAQLHRWVETDVLGRFRPLVAP